MKRCPDCDAEYDDHVEYCFVDGADLIRSEDTSLDSGGSPVGAPPAPQRRGGFLAGGALFLLGGGLLVVLLGVGAATLLLSGPETGDAEVAAVAPVAPQPEPEPEPEPEPPPEPAPVQVAFTSDPDGASVWEGDTELCTTPCKVEHPWHAPLPRTFVLKAGGHRDTEQLVRDPDVPQHVELRRIPRQRPRPKPTTVAAGPPPAPAPVAPQPAPESAPSGDAGGLGEAVKTNDLVDPWGN